nr:FAR1-related sequence 10 [Tanacetum cinerariifolium]
MIDNGDFKIDLLNTVLSCICYENDDELLLYYKIPLKSLDIGLKPLVSDSDISNFLGYINKHKIMYVYVEQVKKNESFRDKDEEGDSQSEDGNDFVDEEHLVDAVEVNMSSFKFQIDGEDETEFIDHIQPHVNVTEDDLEVLDFDSLESDQEDVPENARSRGLIKLRKKHMSSSISNNFYVRKEFPHRDLAKERIKAYTVETRMNLDFKRNDKRTIRVICNGVVLTLTRKHEYVDKVQGLKQDISKKGALERGFKEGGRELLGLDDAFMRGQYPGQMLTAIGVDANNDIYPVAYGIVESKNQYSWTWFLICHAEDFDLFSNSKFTFIIDRQKGLLFRKKSKGKIAIAKGDKLTRKGKTVTCSNCQGIGHNKRGCKATGSSDDGQRYDMSSETVQSEHVETEHVGSQHIGSQVVPSQPLGSEPVGSQAVPSEPVARKYVARKYVARKPVTRKRVATKPVTRKRVASEII